MHADNSSKQALRCNESQQREIDKEFLHFYEEVKQIRTRATLPYPLGYWLASERMKPVCERYNQALQNISGKTKRDCIDTYEIYSQVGK